MADPAEVLAQQITDRVVELVVNALDVNDLVARVDLNVVLGSVDIDAVLKKLDLTPRERRRAARPRRGAACLTLSSCSPPSQPESFQLGPLTRHQRGLMIER
jgi:hypothetical protein